jgi:hypothetical protein
MIKRTAFLASMLLGLLICFSANSEAQQSLRNRLEVGSWYGHAVPDDPSTSPFGKVVMMPTFLADGTVIANDAIEWTNAHGTAHGHWVATGPNTIHATFIWLNLSAEKANGFTGMTKVRLFGRMSPDNPDEMTGKIYPVVFPEGTDALVADDADGIPLGVFTIEQMKRIKVDPAQSTVTGIDLSNEPAMGMWFGRATPENPETAAFAELFIEPTFLDDGNVIFDSSQEERAKLSASHGQWTVENGTIKSTFIWLSMTEEGNSGFTGSTKVRFTGQLTDDNNMTGSFTLVHFPPTADPLDPNDVGGTSGGTYTLQSLQRHRVGPAGSRNLSNHPAVGTWVGRAVPDDPTQSPFPEVYMTPTFHADGNMIANDAIATSLHHTAHGDWFSTGPNGAETTFLFILGHPEAPNGYAGAFKIRLVGEIDPNNPDVMIGQLFPTLYPPDVNPLDPNAQGQPIISLSYQLRRVPVQQTVPTFQPPPHILDRQTHVVATVTQNGEPAAGLEVAFARSIAGLPLDYKWTGTTDANGHVNVKIGASQSGRSGASGYYNIKATNASGVVVSTWGSVPINGGREVTVLLPIGGKADVTNQIDLENLGIFSLIGNSPNPFNPATQIVYELNKGSEIRLAIFNNLGQEVRVLVNKFQSAGQYRIFWDGKDATGRGVASGLYVYRLSSGNVSQTRQMLLLK